MFSPSMVGSSVIQCQLAMAFGLGPNKPTTPRIERKWHVDIIVFLVLALVELNEIFI